MFRFNNYHTPLRFKFRHNNLGNLTGQPFLDLRPAGKYLYYSYDFTQSGDPASFRDISDMRLAQKRKKMVPTEYVTYAVDCPADLERVAKLMPKDPLFPKVRKLAKF